MNYKLRELLAVLNNRRSGYTISIYRPGDRVLYALEFEDVKIFGHVSYTQIINYLKGYIDGLDAAH